MQQSRLSFLLTTALAAACGDAYGPGDYWIDVTNGRGWMELGETVQFAVEAREGEAPTQGPTIPDMKFTWSSSNPSVVSIDRSGTAVAHRIGTSEVGVCAPAYCGYWNITVINPIAGVVVIPDSITLLPYDRLHLTAVPIDAAGDPVADEAEGVYGELLHEMTWSTEDTAVARMGDTSVALMGDPEYSPVPSLVVAVSRGTTRVTARLNEFAGTATVAVIALDLTDISAGQWYTCALTNLGEPYCWGGGFLESDAQRRWSTPRFMPRRTEDPRLSLASLVSGQDHTCGLTSEGAAYCWGSNGSGALGTGESLQPTKPVLVVGGRSYIAITAGGEHTCAIDTGGQLYCWGANRWGELGITSSEECGSGGKYESKYPCTRAPAAVTDRPTFTAVSAGGDHTCGLVADGTTFCWGWIGTHQSPDTVRVPGDHPFTSIASGSGMACGLAAGGEAYCWGSNSDGLGDGSTTESDMPVPVAGGRAFAQLSISYSVSSCGVTPQGELYCWGWGSTWPTPTRIGDSITWTFVDVGSDHACGMSVEGVAYCWGSNYDGALGIPGEDWISEPMRVIGQIEP